MNQFDRPRRHWCGDLGQLHRHRVGESGRIGGAEQRRADLAGANFGAHAVTGRRACGNKPVGAAVDGEFRSDRVVHD